MPNSAGTTRPSAAAPAGACDAHCHIVDPRFSRSGAGAVAGGPAGMSIEDYQQLQRRIGTTRAVFVQAKYHGTDHACLLDAIRRLDGNARGIGVVHPCVTDSELERLDTGGIRGIRFSLWKPTDAIVTVDMIEPLAKRIADLGWHVQLHLSGEQIVEAAALLSRLPCPIVFDHMGRLPPDRGPDHPAFAVILDLVSRGRAWVKLAGAYLNTGQGPPYGDATRMARAFVAQVPERLVWGSDWPHVTETHKPDDAELFDLLALWAGSDRVRDLILVDNPAELYGFR
ncbi:amidohydrolase family protein [Xanthobacter flavus]|uniref:amidohydrolase family protein n=1 Tax=Xanthobacter flavus TaxID=281 RepID=UPI0037298451